MHFLLAESAGMERGEGRYQKSKQRLFSGVMGSAAKLLPFLVFLVTSIDSAQADASELPDLSTIPTPPSFKHEPNPPIIYFVVDPADAKTQTTDTGNVDSLKERRLVCEADGYPEPKCKWLKDGVVLNIEDSNGSITQQEGYGTITIGRLKKSDEGTYQCFCENGNGTAYDRPIQLKQTYIDFFPPSKLDTVPVELGKPFSRSCTPPHSVPPARVFWIYMGAGKSGSSLTAFNSINSSHIAMNDKGAIFLQYVKEDDIQPDLFFTCTVENMELKDYKFGDQFSIKVVKSPGQRFPPYIEPKEQYVSPREVTALRGESFELFCIFSGYPEQKPSWRKIDGAPIDWNRVTYGTNFNKSLKIENVGFQDEGTYECSFFGDLNNERTRNFRVSINSAPYWVASSPHSVNSSEGETVQFDCDAAGRPQPRFTFFKNGKELKADNRRIFIEGSKLKILDLRKGENGEGDNAAYQCKAENEYGFVWGSFYLNLLSFRPVLLAGPGNSVSVLNRDATLSCKFFGSPRPTVTWNAPTTFGNRDYEVDPTGVYKLRLYQVDQVHEGSYECYAENKHGNASGKGTLTIRKPTRLTSTPESATIVAGDTMRLPCKAEADPNLNVRVTWLKHGLPIDTSNGRIVVEADNTLRIDSVVGMDTGEYTCAAETDYDRVEYPAKIVVRDVPAPPVSVYVKCGATSAAIDFHYVEMSQDVPAREFWAQYNIDPDSEPSNWETYPVPVSQLNSQGYGNVQVSLYPYGNFSFRMFARNDIGDSAPTPGDKRCVTPPAKPEKNPGKVLVKGNTPEDVTVYWEPLPRRDWNGPKFHYVVQYNRPGEEPKDMVVEDPDRSSFVIPVNQPYEEYEVSVRSKNSEGESTTTPQKTSGRSGEEKPKTAPSGFVGFAKPGQPTVATFRWDKYNPSDFKGELKGFKVEHWIESSRGKRAETTRKVALFDPSATQGTIYDMKPFAINKARIMAYSGGGDGPASPEETLNMPEGVPTAVQNMEVFALSHSEVGAVWQTPREMNGIFKGYNVSWCKIKTEGLAIWNSYRVDEDSCVRAPELVANNHYRIANLIEDQEYRVEVSAWTGAGAGESNSADVKTLPSRLATGAPVVPMVQEAGIGDDHLNVTWLPGKFDPNDRKPVGDDHYIEYRPKGSDDWIKVPHQGKNFTVQVTGLQPGTTYEVRTVSVVNATPNNYESRSGIVELTTAGEAPVTSTAGWLIAIIVAILILIIILIIVCLVMRNRGAKYPVSEKEKEQGREPMLKEDKGFGEYARPEPDEEKRSLTAESKPESETDSMAEYGDGETGRFTEDGSFIGQYSAPNKVITAPSTSSPNTAVVGGGGGDRGGKNLSTFV